MSNQHLTTTDFKHKNMQARLTICLSIRRAFFEGIWKMNESKNSSDVQSTYTLDALRYAIKSAPVPPKKLTKLEILEAIKKDLIAAQKDGHTAASLATVLQSNGFKISRRAVNDLLRDVQKKC